MYVDFGIKDLKISSTIRHQCESASDIQCHRKAGYYGAFSSFLRGTTLRIAIEVATRINVTIEAARGPTRAKT